MDIAKIENLIKDVVSIVGSFSGAKGSEAEVKYDEKMEALIDAVLEDGKITNEEKSMLLKKAVEMGVNQDDLIKVVKARLANKQNGNNIGIDSIQEIAAKFLSFFNKN